LIIDGTDNFQTKYLINDACVQTDRPWVYASLYKFQGQMSVFNYKDGPTYRCLFPKMSSVNTSCETTGILGVLPGLVGIQQATEALKLILGIGRVLSGQLKIIDSLTHTDQLITIKKNREQIALRKNSPLKLEAL
jgi:adenylyltransferase/sulfurtransferase